jgi:hypothetical protein
LNGYPALICIGKAGQLDVTCSVQSTKGINLSAEGKNLTNTASVRYSGERYRPRNIRSSATRSSAVCGSSCEDRPPLLVAGGLYDGGIGAVVGYTQRRGRSGAVPRKKAKIHVYDLTGKRVSFPPAARLNNVDLRESGCRVIAAASKRADVALFTLDTVQRRLVPISRYPVGLGEAYDMCLWTRAKDKACSASSC